MGNSNPIAEGPRNIPANISPTTLGWPINIRSKLNILDAMIISKICNKKRLNGCFMFSSSCSIVWETPVIGITTFEISFVAIAVCACIGLTVSCSPFFNIMYSPKIRTAITKKFNKKDFVTQLNLLMQ